MAERQLSPSRLFVAGVVRQGNFPARLQRFHTA
jgi:hypothetical protein